MAPAYSVRSPAHRSPRSPASHPRGDTGAAPPWPPEPRPLRGDGHECLPAAVGPRLRSARTGASRGPRRSARPLSLSGESAAAVAQVLSVFPGPCPPLFKRRAEVYLGSGFGVRYFGASPPNPRPRPRLKVPAPTRGRWGLARLERRRGFGHPLGSGRWVRRTSCVCPRRDVLGSGRLGAGPVFQREALGFSGRLFWVETLVSWANVREKGPTFRPHAFACVGGHPGRRSMAPWWPMARSLGRGGQEASPTPRGRLSVIRASSVASWDRGAGSLRKRSLRRAARPQGDRPTRPRRARFGLDRPFLRRFRARQVRRAAGPFPKASCRTPPLLVPAPFTFCLP